MRANKIEISHRTIIFTLLLIVGAWFVAQVYEVLLLLFVAFIIMSALSPWVTRLEMLKIPRVVGILILYLLIFGVFGVTIGSSFPSLVVQTVHLMQELPAVLDRLVPTLNLDVNVFTQQLAPIGENIVRLTVNIFSNVLTIISILVVSFYLLLERNNLERLLKGNFHSKLADELIALMGRIETRLGAWVMGQLFLMMLIGVLVYVGLVFLRVDYALPLAIIAGMLEFVPVAGPILSAIPAVIVALSHSPILAVSVVALFFLVQQLENQLIVPLVMRRSVGVSPLVTILTLMVGSKLAGLVGVLLGLPIFVVCEEIFFWYLKHRDNERDLSTS